MPLRRTRNANSAFVAVGALFYRPKEERASYGPLSSRKEAPKIADSEQFEQAIKKRGAGGASSFLLGPRARARGVLLLHVPPYFSAEFLERSARAREGVAFKVRSSLKKLLTGSIGFVFNIA